MLHRWRLFEGRAHGLRSIRGQRYEKGSEKSFSRPTTSHAQLDSPPVKALAETENVVESCP
jgi:hypothetical protein